jgi:hypothetical protein
MPSTGDIRRADHTGVWYRQPVLWLGVATFVASLAGCVWMIVLGVRHADTPVDAPHAVFGVPAGTHDSTENHGHQQ